MIKLRYVFGGLLCIGLLWKGIEGCSGFSSNSGVRKALKAGELSEAVEKCNASTSHEVSSDLLDALLKVGQVDKAKMLLQRLFPEDDRTFRDNYARAYIPSSIKRSSQLVTMTMHGNAMSWISTTLIMR